MSSFQLSRRQLLQAGMAGAAMLAGAGAVLRQPRTASAAQSFSLTVQAGTLTMTDGRSIPVWGYAAGGVLKVPATPLIVAEGESVSVQLTNQRSEPHDFYIPGVISQVSVAPGATYTYTFTAPVAGTYLFYDSLSPVHRSMGLYGALVVTPPGGGNAAWTGGPTFDKQFVWVLSSLDETWNNAAAAGQAVDTNNYRPNYFLLNGKGGHQMATAEITSPVMEANVGQTTLVRQLNASLVPNSWHYHGYHFLEITRNTTRYTNPRNKDTFLLYPGDTCNVMTTFDQPGEYPMHDHILMGATANGSYPNGAMGMMHIM